MADRQFDRTVINTRERPMSQDINQLQSQLDRMFREFALLAFAGRTSMASDARNALSGFVGDSYKVRPTGTPDKVIHVTSGMGFQVTSDSSAAIGGVSGLDDRCTHKPLSLAADEAITVPDNGLGVTRYDIVEVAYDRRVENAMSRDVLNPATGAFVSSTVNKTMSFEQTGRSGIVTTPNPSTAGISLKVGDALGSPPATTSGYVKIAELVVPAGFTSLSASNIRDLRKPLLPGGQLHAALDFATSNVEAPAGVFKPTTYGLIAPPGVHASAVDSGNPGEADIFLVCGDTPLAALAWAQSVLGVDDFANLTLTSIGTITSGEQTALADSSRTSNPLSVAVGQPRVKWHIDSSVGAFSRWNLGMLVRW